MKNFQALGLNPDLNDSLAKMGYEKPTPIQAQAIPFALLLVVSQCQNKIIN